MFCDKINPPQTSEPPTSTTNWQSRSGKVRRGTVLKWCLPFTVWHNKTQEPQVGLDFEKLSPNIMHVLNIIH